MAPLHAVELVRVRAMTLPRGELIRIRGPLVAWSAPSDAGRQYRAMAAFAAAFEAALAAAGGSGGRA